MKYDQLCNTTIVHFPLTYFFYINPLFSVKGVPHILLYDE